MRHRRLSRSTLTVSVIGLGGNTFGPPRQDEQMTRRILHFAQDLGINFVDTAMSYGEGKSEEFIGTALEGRRDKWVVATKFSLRNLGEKSPRDHIRMCAENSLRKLRTDYIDLFQLHQPNLEVAEDEILRALDDLTSAGKVREIGASNHHSWHLAKNLYTARTLGVKHYITSQEHYNLLRRQIEVDLVPFAEHYGVDIIPFFPLAGGFLTGKYKKDVPPPSGSRGAEGSGIIARNANERNYNIVPAIESFANERGRTAAELALAWLLANPAVRSVITGASNTEQVAANAKAADWVLSKDEKEQVNTLAPREGDDSSIPLGAKRAAPLAASSS